MNKTVTLTEASIKNYAAFLTKRNNEIDSLIEPLLDEKQDNLRQLQELGVMPSNGHKKHEPEILFDSSQVFKAGWGLMEKAHFILGKKKKVLNAGEIIRTLGEENDPTLIATRDDEREYIRKLSTGLKQHIDRGKLMRINDDEKGWLYGLPEWFKDGKLKPEYR